MRLFELIEGFREGGCSVTLTCLGGGQAVPSDWRSAPWHCSINHWGSSICSYHGFGETPFKALNDCLLHFPEGVVT